MSRNSRRGPSIISAILMLVFVVISMEIASLINRPLLLLALGFPVAYYLGRQKERDVQMLRRVSRSLRDEAANRSSYAHVTLLDDGSYTDTRVTEYSDPDHPFWHQTGDRNVLRSDVVINPGESDEARERLVHDPRSGIHDLGRYYRREKRND